MHAGDTDTTQAGTPPLPPGPAQAGTPAPPHDGRDAATAHAPASTCENCGAALHGAYCHACGQHTHSPVRSFGHAVEEVFEAFWHLDGRVFRTLRDLLSPGRVAIGYLAGHRARYIAPLRLFVVLSVLTFFVAQVVIRVDATPEEAAALVRVDPPGQAEGPGEINRKFFAKADSVAEVERRRRRELADLRRALDAVPSAVVVARRGIEREIEALERGAEARIAELRVAQQLSDADIAAAKAEVAAQSRPDDTRMDASDAFEATLAQAATLADVERLRAARLGAQRVQLDALPATAALERKRQLREMRRSNEQAGCRVAQLQIEQAQASEGARRRKPLEDANVYGDPECVVEVRMGGGDSEPWDEETNPVRIERAPGFVNRWLNRQIAHGKDSVARAQKDPSLYVRALLGAVPSALFLLVPVFALLLKVAYLGSGRVYLEHLVVALYSHAWLCLAVLASVALAGLDNAFTPAWPPTGWIIGLLQLLLWLWLPLYLLLMQKRVYRNGWPVTLLRYFVIGNLYFVLLGFVAVFLALASLVRM